MFIFICVSFRVTVLVTSKQAAVIYFRFLFETKSCIVFLEKLAKDMVQFQVAISSSIFATLYFFKIELP